jgi:hypothetical protein
LFLRGELQSSPTLLAFFSFFPPPSRLVVRAGQTKNKNSAHQLGRVAEGKSSEFYIAYFIFAAASFTTYVFAGSVILPFQTNCIAASGSKGAEYCTTLFWCCRGLFSAPSLRALTLQQVLPRATSCKHTHK